MSATAKYIPVTAVLLLFAWSTAGASSIESSWLGLIKKNFAPSCAVTLTKVGKTVAGNNGLRSEQWFLQTCQGKFEYWVSYYPTAAFPNRTSPYEVKQVSKSGGSAGRPNISFKADGAYSGHIDHKFRQKLINIPVAITSSPLS